MRIFLIALFIFFSNSHAKEITFLCNISEELENGKPALKKNYEQTPIYLYLDKNHSLQAFQCYKIFLVFSQI